MREIPVYKSCHLFGWARVSECDYERIVQFKWVASINDLYAARWNSTTKKAVLMHQEVMGCSPGDGLEIDHRDGDGFNNMRSNLRLATRSQQIQNTRTRSKYGRGVTLNPNGRRFIAQGKVNGKVSYLGTYDTADEAARVAAEWRAVHHDFHRERASY